MTRFDSNRVHLRVAKDSDVEAAMQLLQHSSSGTPWGESQANLQESLP